MAEIAIPLIALGSMYIYSNKNKKIVKNTEGFRNKGTININSNNLSELSNTNVLNKNYPVNQDITIKESNYVNQYLNSNQSTDNILKKQVQNDCKQNNSVQFNNMCGNKIDLNDFKHNNMVPFFGAKVTGPQVNNTNEGQLDSRVGSGTYNIKRVEQAPLFKPQENLENVFGSPNKSDFIQSRQMASQKISNVLPWEQEKVAPGLGLGFNTDGVGGFNSGMMQRETWQPPTVDELRTKNNQKETFSFFGHEGPAESKVTNIGKMGTMEKNRPDTDYKLGADRWFTSTNSNNLAQTQRGIIELNENNRMNTTNEYYGVGTSGCESKPNYYRGTYEPSQKVELGATEFNPANGVGQTRGEDLTLRNDSYKIFKNNRNDNCQPDSIGVGGINATFKAILAPVIDVLKPTRKENVIGNANQSGNVQTLVPSLPITNPYDTPKTTVKETTQGRIGLNHLNVSHIASSNNGAYINSKLEAKDQQRNFGNYSSFGNMQGQGSEIMRTAWDNQHNNVNKTAISRPNPGSMDMYNGDINMDIHRNENDIFNTREPVPSKKLPNPNNFEQPIPSSDNFGRMAPINQLSNHMNEDRMNPEILSAFKSNPYAHSLNSY